MSEESRDERMDDLLRRSMAAPVPSLSRNFHKDAAREWQRRITPPTLFGFNLLAIYAVLSAVTCILVMRGQGLAWLPISLLISIPLALVEVGRRVSRRHWGRATTRA